MHKFQKNTILYISLALLLVATGSCKFKSKGRLNKEAFELEQKAFDKIIATYQIIRDKDFVEEYEVNKLNIIFKNTDSTFNPRKLVEKVDGITNKQEEAKRTMKLMAMLQAIRKEDNKLLHDSIVTQLIGFEHLLIENSKRSFYKNWKSPEKQRIENFKKQLAKAIELKRIKDKELFNNEIINAYIVFWKRDMRLASIGVMRSIKKVNNRIDQLPDSIFNNEKLRQVLNEPYSNSGVLVGLYKENMKKAFNEQAKKFGDDFETLNEAIDKILEINELRYIKETKNAELSRRVNEIDQLLSTKKESR